LDRLLCQINSVDQTLKLNGHVIHVQW
jgi:hypothetical protein